MTTIAINKYMTPGTVHRTLEKSEACSLVRRVVAFVRQKLWGFLLSLYGVQCVSEGIWKLSHQRWTVPSINSVPLSSKSTLFGCFVKEDLSPVDFSFGWH